MKDTELNPSGEQMGRMAQGHHANGMDAPAWPVFAWFAAGGLRSTAQDMLRFGEANLGHKQIDGKLLPDELISAMKMAQQPLYLLPNEKAEQGLAWVTHYADDHSKANPEIVKNGGTVGFASAIVLNPRKDAVVFIATNQSKSKPAQIALELGRHLPAPATN